MFEDYAESQKLAYDMLMKDIENNYVTHAYFINENDYSDSFNFVLSFVKTLMCKNLTINKGNCNTCPTCKRINSGNYPEVKIVCPDGAIIKKQQIIDLQQSFSKGAVEGQRLIYIIRDCDKMRPEAANSMLKFLEEPDVLVTAILLSNNVNNVLPTILSRCKIIKLMNSEEKILEDDEFERTIIDFIYSVEINGLASILDIDTLWRNKIDNKDREKVASSLNLMIDFYYDLLHYIMFNKVLRYGNYIEKIKLIVDKNTEKSIIKKINYLVEQRDNSKYNINNNLMIDSLIVNIGGNL